MRTEELNYDLPEELIAQKPAEERSESRLLVLNRETGELFDRKFSDIGEFLQEGDCLVINDTKVLPARFYGNRVTGANLEGLYLSQKKVDVWEIMLKGMRKVKVGEEFILNDKEGNEYLRADLMEKLSEGKCIIKVKSDEGTGEILGKIGFPPLPPYIKRDTDIETAEEDKERYQTVYAKNSGAVAAPTAGLHFTDYLLENLKEKGIKFAHVTLHVGAGTFRPVKTEDLRDHDIHSERYRIDEENAKIIKRAKQEGKKVIAVGTTSVRTLETVAKDGKLTGASGDTELFIMPGFEFKIIDGMVTNFHLPKSTLLALVATFCGIETIKKAYKHAVEEKYRFFSYGDAMLII